jgi:hypothetical protein
MLDVLLSWVETEHGEWWRAALAKPPNLDGLSVRELYRRGYVIATACPRHSTRNSRMVYSVFEIEAIVGPNTYVIDTLPVLKCPRCRASVTESIVVTRIWRRPCGLTMVSAGRERATMRGSLGREDDALESYDLRC